MSQPDTPQSADAGNGESTPQAEQTTPTPNPSPTESKKETDWVAEARKWEARAKANTDAARRLQEIEDRDKSELEKERSRREKAEATAAEKDRELLRFKVAAETNVPAGLIHGADEDAMRQSAKDALDWRGNAVSQAPSAPNLAPGGEKSRARGAEAAAALYEQRHRKAAK